MVASNDLIKCARGDIFFSLLIDVKAFSIRIKYKIDKQLKTFMTKAQIIFKSGCLYNNIFFNDYKQFYFLTQSLSNIINRPHRL